MLAKKNRGLGRDFGSLIPVDLLDETFDPTAEQDHRVSELRYLKLEDINPDFDQPRKNFDKDELQALAESIREHGVLQPIIVTQGKEGYQIVAGERRYRASKLVGLTKIPAIVRTLSAQNKLELSLIENLQRQDLNPLETATAYLKLRDQFNLSLSQIGERLGLSLAAVSNRLRLLRLPEQVKSLVVDGKLSEGQARNLIGLDQEILDAVLPKILKEGWSVRRIEQLIVDLKKNQAEGITTVKEKIKNPYQDKVDFFQKKLKMNVKIQTNTRGAGYVMIRFKDPGEFEKIETLLRK